MTAELHPSIVALVALAANIAAKHPKQGLCQLDKLRQYNVPQAHIDTVIEIARHIRDEAGQLLDASFDAARAAGNTQVAQAAPAQVTPEHAAKPKVAKGKPLNVAIAEAGGACCTPTPGGKSCC
ncbi:MAG: hypothetical protein AB1697_06805 [Pseudomonadota bacterium]